MPIFFNPKAGVFPPAFERCQHPRAQRLLLSHKSDKRTAHLAHLDLGVEAVHHCADCGETLWGEHQHVVLADHAAPQYMLCEDCGVVLGTWQPPVGREEAPHGLICGDCGEGRRHEEDRRVEEEAAVDTPAAELPIAKARRS